MPNTSSSFYTPQFLLLCLSSLFFFMSFSMIIPELPDYLRELGGEDYIGLIIGIFTFSALISRPFSGKLADTIGRKPVIYFGVFMSALSGLMYPWVSSVFAFLLLRFIHGFSTGFAPTGNSASAADMVPIQKRGEAMGVLGLMTNIGTAMGPALGSHLTVLFSINAMFYTASLIALLSMLVLWNIKETLESKQNFKLKLLQVRKNEILEPQVFLPAFIMLLYIYFFGVVLTVTPDMSKALGLSNKGIFFTFYTLSSLLMRFLAGRASDLYGRVIIIKIALLILFFGLIYIGFAESWVELLISAVIFGIATGIASPTLFAWTIDLSQDKYRGRALATLFIALEAGIGAGAILGAWFYDSQIKNLPSVFWANSGLVVLAFLLLEFRRFLGLVKLQK